MTTILYAITLQVNFNGKTECDREKFEKLATEIPTEHFIESLLRELDEESVMTKFLCPKASWVQTSSNEAISESELRFPIKRKSVTYDARFFVPAFLLNY